MIYSTNALRGSPQDTHFDYETLGTLCDEPNCLTCSFFIAQQWNRAQHVKPYPTYELAAADVKAGLLDVCLVAGAYPRMNALIFDEGLKVVDSFVRQIPPLVLVGFHEQPPDDIRVLYHHPATTPLLGETGLTFQPTEHVTSNSMACKMLLESPDDTVCITNQLCSDYYGLHIYKVLRAATMMPWIVFGRADDSLKVAANGHLTETVGAASDF